MGFSGGFAKIKGSVMPFIKWLKSAYSESDGSGSSTRLHIAILISFIIGVGVSFAISEHRHIITIEQFNSFLVAGGTFLMSTCGALYGINKVGSYMDGKNNPDPAPDPDAAPTPPTPPTPPAGS